jgi:ABC-type phosphate/phosphonate transport system permease subunit
VTGLDLSFDAPWGDWWPFVFILLAGWLPTDAWRYLGVLTAGRMDEHSPIASLARTIATALVAAVIAQLVLFPAGSLAAVPAAARIGAVAAGFLAYLICGRRVLAAIVVAEIILVGGALLF